MSEKVKRGLGMLAVGALGFIALLVLSKLPAEGDTSGSIVTTLLLAAWLAFIVGLVWGLVLVAWGFLRD